MNLGASKKGGFEWEDGLEEGGESLVRIGVVMVVGLGRRVSGYSSSKRWIMPSRVESRNLSRPGWGC